MSSRVVFRSVAPSIILLLVWGCASEGEQTEPAPAWSTKSKSILGRDPARPHVVRPEIPDAINMVPASTALASSK